MKVSKHFRLSLDVLRMIDEIASLYSSPFGKVTATQVVEQAIQRLYAEIEADEIKEGVHLDS